MVSYATTIRKEIKWNKKLGIQLLLGISVDALTIYKIASRKSINIRIFGELLVAKLLGLSENTKNPCLRPSQKNDSGRSITRVCKLKTSNGPNKGTKEFEGNSNLLSKLSRSVSAMYRMLQSFTF